MGKQEEFRALQSLHVKKYQHLMLDMEQRASEEDAEDQQHLECVHTATNHPVVKLQNVVIGLLRRYGSFVRKLCLLGVLACYVVYLAFSISYSLEGSVFLMVVTCLVIAACVYGFVRDRYGDRIHDAACVPSARWLDKQWYWLSWVIYVGLVLAVTWYLVWGVISTWRQMRSLLGMAIFVALPLFTCKYPKSINWRPVLWGLGLQFIVGVLVLRWRPGYEFVKWLSQLVNSILSHSMGGATAVFGDPLFFLHAFFMLVIPMVLYIGSLLGIMYYLGITQWFCVKMGFLMAKTLQTTAIESVCLAANIFLSVLDIILMLKPFIPQLTPSEFHTFLVGSHATIAGFAFGIIVLFGVSPQHLLTGAVMSAPAAVAIAKLNFPEKEVSKLKDIQSLNLDNGPDRNVVDACVNGAWLAAKSGTAILVQIMAFMGLYFLFDGFVVYLGMLVGLDLQLHTLLGYCFVPIAWLMGIDEDDIMHVSSMLGLKVLANEFLGFYLLGKSIRIEEISERSSAIATYAMCGFSSLGTLTIFLGVWNTIDSSRTGHVASIMPRILMNSNLACFMTACIAALFYDDTIAFEESTETSPILEAFFRLLEGLPDWAEIVERLGLGWSDQ